MNYITNDFYFSEDGDFILSANRDIQETSSDPYRSLFQEIKARLNYNRGEWPNNLGANITDFNGKENTRENAEKIKLRMTTELTRNGFLNIKDFNITIVPLSSETLLAIINIKSGTKLLTYNHKFSNREKTFGTKGSS